MKSTSCEAKRNVMEIPFVYINFFFFFFRLKKNFSLLTVRRVT